MNYILQHRIISRSFLALAMLRFIYLMATNAIYGFTEVIVVAVLGCLINLAVERAK